MKKTESYFRKLSLFTSLALLASLVLFTLADSNCYTYSASGKHIIMHEQVIRGIDCFTGKYNPPLFLPADYDTVDGKYGVFSFERFRTLYLGMFGLVSLSAILLLWKKKVAALILAILGFFMAMICLIYFDGYHNYYFDAAGERFEASLTLDINFGWLSNIFFWLLFVAVIVMNFMGIIIFSKKKETPYLLDN